MKKAKPNCTQTMTGTIPPPPHEVGWGEPGVGFSDLCGWLRSCAAEDPSAEFVRFTSMRGDIVAMRPGDIAVLCERTGHSPVTSITLRVGGGFDVAGTVTSVLAEITKQLAVQHWNKCK